jgi:hypothetical protein
MLGQPRLSILGSGSPSCRKLRSHLELSSSDPLAGLGIFAPRLRSPPIMDNLFDIMDHTVEHPLHVHFDLASQRQPISSLLGADIAKDWFHNGEPLTIYLPCFWRVDLRDHRLGQRLVGGLNIDGQMFAARLGVL